MAYSAAGSYTSQGFELWRYTTENEILWLPGDPGVTFTKGDQVVMDLTTAGSSGTLIVHAGSAVGVAGVGPLGRVMQTTVCPASSTSFPKPAEFDPVDRSGSNLCLVPVKIDIAAGVPIYRVTFANHQDETVAGYSAPDITDTTGHSANDYPNGALLYVYEGPGIGEVNIVEDYVHAGPTTKCHRNFATALTTSSKYISLDGEAATFKGVHLFGRCEPEDEDNITVAGGANDGEFVVYGSWQEMGMFLSTLSLPVVNAKHLTQVNA